MSCGLIYLVIEEGKLQLEEATVGYGGKNNLVDKKVRNAYTSAVDPEKFSWLYKLIEKEISKQNLENYKFNLDRIEHL